jgi:large subunit ribosomal protein L13
VLRGKHKPIFAPHMDTGDHVIIVNAEKAVLTGGKETKKVAYRHSGYPGGITGVRYDRLMAERPAFAVEKAVRGMLPKNRLGRAMGRKLHVVAGPDHPHQAQQPVALAPGERPRWEGLPQPTPLKPRHVKAPKRADEAAASAAPKRSAAKEPVAAEKPSTRKTTAAKSTATKTAARKPAAKKPAAKKPTAKASTAKRSTSRAAKDEEA